MPLSHRHRPLFPLSFSRLRRIKWKLLRLSEVNSIWFPPPAHQRLRCYFLWVHEYPRARWLPKSTAFRALREQLCRSAHVGMNRENRGITKVQSTSKSSSLPRALAKLTAIDLVFAGPVNDDAFGRSSVFPIVRTRACDQERAVDHLRGLPRGLQRASSSHRLATNGMRQRVLDSLSEGQRLNF